MEKEIYPMLIFCHNPIWEKKKQKKTMNLPQDRPFQRYKEEHPKGGIYFCFFPVKTKKARFDASYDMKNGMCQPVFLCRDKDYVQTTAGNGYGE